MRNTRVLIVDDHPASCRDLAAILTAMPSCEVCGTAATGREAIDAAGRLAPDIVVMDISMHDRNGLDATRRLHRAYPDLEIVVLSMLESEQLIREVFASGARAYVTKTNVSAELPFAIERVRGHALFFTPPVAETILRHYLDGPANTGTPPDSVKPVSLREREVMQLVAEGKSNKEIAALLAITVKTVETHRAHIMSKLGLNSVAELVRYAIRHGIVPC